MTIKKCPGSKIRSGGQGRGLGIGRGVGPIRRRKNRNVRELIAKRKPFFSKV